MKFFAGLAIGMCLLASCSSSKRAHEPGGPVPVQVSRLEVLDEYSIRHKMPYQGTVLGGLSGIDYDSVNNKYYIISDDRSDINAARFYTVNINLKNDQVDTVVFISSHPLLSPAGTSFPSHRKYPQLSPDPESIRFNYSSKNLIWTSEGGRQQKDGVEILQHPFIYEMDSSGRFLDSFFIPGNLKMKTGNKGPRRNAAFEGSSFANNNELLFVSCEEPLLQDGPAAAVNMAGALTRITKFDTKSKNAIAQFVYPLEAIAHAPKPAGAFAVNGISEILALNEQQLLVVERSFSTGRLINSIKIFLADFSNASNVLNKFSLSKNKSFKPAAKKLLFNSDDLNRYIDNVEGICFGPRLSNGNRTLLLIVDDNFNPLQKTQLFLLELVP